MEAMGRVSRLLFGGVLDLLFPPVCAGCRVAIGAPDALCPECWRGISFIERPYCEVLGSPFAFDPGPGALSPEAMADPPPYARLRSAVLYRDLSARLVSALKYGDRSDLAPLMSAWMARAGAELLGDADVLVPIPLHRGRLWRRRFNQSAELARRIAAMPVARERQTAYAPLALDRVKPTRAQVGLARTERLTNVQGAFGVPRERRAEIAGKRVVLVDDVFTTGATVASATRALKRGGAATVDVLTFARVAANA